MHDEHYLEREKNKVLASVLLVLATRPGCNLTVKTRAFLKILALSCFSLLHIILSHGDCNKNLQNLSLRGSKTIPKGASTSVASWKYFRIGFGTILDSQMGSSSRALRRPRRLQRRHLFTLASLDASRNDFGGHLDLLGLDFKQFLDTLSAAKLSPMSPKTGCPSSCALHSPRHRPPDRSTEAEVAKH